MGACVDIRRCSEQGTASGLHHSAFGARNGRQRTTVSVRVLVRPSVVSRRKYGPLGSAAALRRTVWRPLAGAPLGTGWRRAFPVRCRGGGQLALPPGPKRKSAPVRTQDWVPARSASRPPAAARLGARVWSRGKCRRGPPAVAESDGCRAQVPWAPRIGSGGARRRCGPRLFFYRRRKTISSPCVLIFHVRASVIFGLQKVKILFLKIQKNPPEDDEARFFSQAPLEAVGDSQFRIERCCAIECQVPG